MGGKGSGRRSGLRPGSLAAQKMLESMRVSGTTITSMAEMMRMDDARLHRILTGRGQPTLTQAINAQLLCGALPEEWLEEPEKS